MPHLYDRNPHLRTSTKRKVANTAREEPVRKKRGRPRKIDKK